MTLEKQQVKNPYWAESAFSGMPTYPIGTYFPNDYITSLDRSHTFST